MQIPLFIVDSPARRHRTARHERGAGIGFERLESRELLAVDLRIVEAIAPPSIQQGQMVDVSFTIDNVGDESAISPGYAIYLSQDEVVDANDVLVSSWAAGGEGPQLNPSESLTIDRAVSLAGQSPGLYNLIFVVNGDQSQSDDDTSNNAYAVPLELLPSDANLRPTTFVAPDFVNAGELITVSYHVDNIGLDAITDDWTDAVYLSSDEFLDENDRYLGGYFSGTGVGAGEGYDGTIDVSIDTSIAGLQYLILRSDAFDSIQETDETDNNLVFLISVDVPDLVASNLRGSNAEILGDEITIVYNVANNNPTPAVVSPWYDVFYLSDDEFLDDSDTLVGAGAVNRTEPLEGFASFDVTQTFRLRAGTVTSQYLLVEVNGGKNQPETDFSNNVVARAMTFTAPDLQLTSINVPLLASSGQSITVDWSVANISDVNAPLPGNDFLFLSTDEVWDDSDTYLGNKTSPFALSSGAFYSNQTTVVVNPTSPGDYFILVVASPYDQPDTDSSNNVLASPISIGQPDLTVTTATLPSTIVVGSRVPITWTVENIGQRPGVTNWTDAFYSSSDDILDPLDILISSQFISGVQPLDPGEHYTFTRDINFDRARATDQYILVVTNRFGSQQEVDETNNMLAVPVSFQAPDLSIVDFKSPAAGEVGGTISLEWTVQNIGDVNAISDWFDSIYLSDDATYSFNDTFLDLRSASAISPLSPDGFYTFTLVVTLPLSAASAGPKYLILKVDDNNNQSETTESNNVLAAPILITTPMANLEVIDATAPSAALVGQAIDVSWTVTNSGSDPANTQWTDNVYLSDDAILDANDRFVATRPVGGNSPLLVGGEYVHDSTFFIPGGIGSGQKFLIFITDASEAQPETNETDNLFVLPILISGADLVINSATAPTSATAGQTITVNWIGSNTGSVSAAGDWNDGIYLSTDNVFDPFEDALLDYAFVPDASPLAPGATYAASRQVVIPANVSGSRYIFVRAQASGPQGETDFSNNASLPLAIEISPITQVADLVVTGATAPSAAVIGETISIAYTVQNSGSGTASSDWLDAVYLSSDATLSPDDAFLNSFDIAEFSPLAAGASYTVNRTARIGNAAPGSYFLLFAADASVRQGEISDTNNTFSLPISLSTTNLTLTNAVVPSEGALGQSISLSWTVQNTGANPAFRNWFDDVFISNDQFLSGDDSQLISVNGAAVPLAAGASFTTNINAVIPQTGTGNRFVIIRVDSANSLIETNESDNLIVLPISLVGDDLIVESANAPASAQFGDSITLDWTVRNIGIDAATADWFDNVYLSRDNILNDNDLLLGRSSAAADSPLAAGASYNRTFVASLPILSTLDGGVYYILIKADGGGDQPETDNNNNVFVAGSIDLTVPPLPDLVPTDIIVPTTAEAGGLLNIGWTIRNEGSANATGNWQDRVYLSKDDTLDPFSDTLLGEFNYNGSLGAGDELERVQTVQLPTTLGQYRVFVVTDYNNTIIERTGESNNGVRAANTLTVVPALLPNLVVTDVVAPADGVFTGQTVNISYTVTNTGNAPTNKPFWFDVVFFTQDPGIAVTPQLLVILENLPGQYVGVGNAAYLNPGESYTQSATITLRDDRPGPWYIYVWADGTLFGISGGGPFLRESNDVDNLGRSAEFRVDPAPPADLQVTSIAPATTIFSGQASTVSYQVGNLGTGGTATSAWTDSIYFSADNVLDASDIKLADVQRTGSLASGGSYTQAASITTPVGLSGNYYLIVRADRDAKVYESVFEDNNNLAIPIVVTLTPPPDLVVNDVAGEGTALAGQLVTVSYRVSNDGSTAPPSGAWNNSIYLSEDGILDSADVLLNVERTYLPSAVGDELLITSVVRLPDGIEGDYRFIVAVDSDDEVFEIDNANNIVASAAPLSIISRPADLVVESVEVPAGATNGSAIIVSWTVRNLGNGPTQQNAWFDKIYLSADGLPGGDIYLGRLAHNGTLEVGESYSASRLVTLPVGVSGAYRILVVADAPTRKSEDGVTAIDNGPRAAIFEGTNDEANVAASSILAIDSRAGDLRVTSAATLNSPSTGGPVVVQWTVQNTGQVRTNTEYWYDDLYLSIDPNADDGNDIYLGSQYHSGSLDVGETYLAQKTLTLPENLAPGTYYILLRTDRPIIPNSGNINDVNHVFEASQEGNNTRATEAFAVTASDVPDLIVTSVTAPTVGYSGRSITVGWTVENVGLVDAISRNGAYIDAVYLSLDDSFDATSDVLLGGIERGTLAAGGSYQGSLTVTIPSGVAGLYRVFVATDVRGEIYERDGDFNNALAAPLPIEISFTQPVDLVAGLVTIPANLTAGQKIGIGYSVTNAGTLIALGDWTDAIYLSADQVWDANDALFGRVQRTGNLAPGESYESGVSGEVPGLAPGDYYVIVRSDVRNAVPETDEANNLVASVDAVAVDFPALTLGVSQSSVLTTGGSAYYRVDVETGQTLRIRLDASSSSSINELYVSRGALPMRGLADFLPDDPFQSDQEITVPTTIAGTYYILIYNANSPTGPTAYSIVADLVPFTIDSVDPSAAGNAGPTTLLIRGAQFNSDVSFALVAPGGGIIVPTSVFLANASTAYATFDLAGLATGTYGVRATTIDGEVVNLANAVSVTTGIGSQAVAELGLPARFFKDRFDTFQVNYGNLGDADLIAPLLIVTNLEGTPIGFSDETVLPVDYLMFLGIGFEGPAGILRPGQVETINLHLYGAGDSAQFQLEYLTADSTQLIDWEEFERTIRPDAIPADEWDPAFAGIRARVGETWGGLVRTLAEVATVLSQRGERVYAIGDLLTELYSQEASDNFHSSISGRVVASVDGSPVANAVIWASQVDPNNLDVFDPVTGELLPYDPETEGLLRLSGTDANGEFAFNDLAPGTYELFVDGYNALRRQFFTVTKTNDVTGVLFKVEVIPTPPEKDFTPEVKPTVDSEPRTVVDSAGRTHMLWNRDGLIWHAVYDGTSWSQAQQISDVAGIQLELTYDDRLIDGQAPGLLATWIQGSNNDSDVFGKIGRQREDGTWQWSETIKFSDNAVHDDNVSAIILDDGTPLFVWEKSDSSITDDGDIYFRTGSTSGLVFPSAALVAETLSGDVLAAVAAASTPAEVSAQGDGAWRFRAAFRDVTDIPKWIPYIGGKYSLTFRGSSEGKFEGKKSATLQLSAEYLFKPGDGKVWEIGGGVIGRWTAKNVQEGKCPAPQPDWQIKYGTVGLRGSATGFFDVKKGNGIVKWVEENVPILKDVLKAVKFGPRVEFALQLNANWNPQKATEPTIRWPSTVSGKFSYGGGAQEEVEVDLAAIGSIKGTARQVISGFMEFDSKNGFRFNKPSETKFTLLFRGELKSKIMIPNPLDPFGPNRVPLAGYIDFTKIWTGADFGLQSAQDASALEQTPFLSLGAPTLGTFNDYLETDGIGGRLSAQDNTGQSASLVKSQSGAVYASVADDLGVHGYRYNAALGSWTNLGIVPGTEGVAINKEGIKLAVDGNGRLIATWTQSSYFSTTLNENSTPEDILDVLKIGGDLFYSTFDETTGLWSAAASVAVIPGMDGQLSLATASNGDVWATWTNGNAESGVITIYSSHWDTATATWEPATAIHSGRIMSAPSMTFVGGKPTIFWTEDVALSAQDFEDSDILSATFNSGTWSAPTKFEPSLSIETLKALVASADANEDLTAQEAETENWFENTFEPPDPDEDDCTPPPPPNKPPKPKPDPYPPPSSPPPVPVVVPTDPNDILGPVGFGDPGFIPSDAPLDYTIRFENIPEAGASAQTVVITEQLDADLDYRTFRIGDFGFGGVTYDVPDNVPYFTQRIDLRASRGYFVDFAGSIDVTTGLARWTFTTVDPATGEVPRSGAIGFLPPNIADAVGEGFVRYSISAKNSAVSGDVIDAQASIVFNTELPIATPVWSNTLDVASPISQVIAISEVAADGTFVVSWNGSDEPAGSAIKSFDIFVSVDGGPYRPWLTDTLLREALYDGDLSRTYAFLSIARDNAGNVETRPVVADAEVYVPGIPGIIVSPVTSPTTSESGASATFTVVLAAKPSGDVLVPLSVTKPGEASLSTDLIAFTIDNWDMPQQVVITGLDDRRDDGDQAYLIVIGPALSDDAGYDGLTSPSLNLTNIDNDTFALNVTQVTTGPLTEAGGSITYAISFATQPTAEVIVSISVDDPSEALVSTNGLIFNPLNFDQVQFVTVTGRDDSDDDGEVPFHLLIGPAVSTDPQFQFASASIPLATIDNDGVGFAINPIAGLTTTEAGGSASFTVALTSRPTSDVTISLTTSDASEGTPSVSQIVFTADNWDQPQTVIVMGVGDDDIDGSVAYQLILGQAASADPLYASLDPIDVSLTNLDDDVAGVIVEPPVVRVTTEAGSSVVAYIRLAARPSAAVIVPLAVSDTTEALLNTASVVFTPENWNIAQPVVVSGKDDSADDGDISFDLTVGPTLSTDPHFQTLPAQTIALTNLDDDVAGVIVTPTVNLQTTEAGGQAVFSVVLTSQPTATVAVSLVSSRPLEGIPLVASLTFTAANWFIPQLVTVIGSDDSLQDGDQNYQIQVGPIVSQDSIYATIDPADVSLINLDDDGLPVDRTPPIVTVATIARGEEQRSFVDEFRLDFSERTTASELIASGAILNWLTLTNLGVNADVDPDQAITLAANQFRYVEDSATGGSSILWSYNAFGPRTRSLADGQYVLRLSSAGITDTAGNLLDGDRDAVAGGDYTLRFHRLLGDVNGDGRTQAQDSSIVNAAFGARPTSSQWNGNADLDKDGVITVKDRTLAYQATGRSITFTVDVGDQPSTAITASFVATGTTPFSTQVSSTIDYAGDIDWYKLPVDRSGTFVVTATWNQALLGAPSVALYGSTAAGGFERIALGQGTVSAVAVGGRSYYFQISSAETVGRYTATAELHAFDDYYSMVGFDRAVADHHLTGQGYAVAVIDTGVNYLNEDLAGRVILGPDFGNGDNDPMDTVGHGTQVAGLIASSNSYALGGASDSNIVAVKVTRDGSMNASIANIQSALEWVLAHREIYNIVAVNLSFGSGFASKGETMSLETLYRQLAAAGVFIAVSAGNGYSPTSGGGLNILAASTTVAAVGAVWDSDAGSASFASGARDNSTAADRIASFSQRDAGLDLLAPGADVRTIQLNGGWSERNGTSYAAPLVAAASVLVRQKADREGLSLSTAQILSVLRASGVVVVDGDDEVDNVVNTGQALSRLNVDAALAMVGNGGLNFAVSGTPMGSQAPFAAMSAMDEVLSAAEAIRLPDAPVGKSNPLDGHALKRHWFGGFAQSFEPKTPVQAEEPATRLSNTRVDRRTLFKDLRNRIARSPAPQVQARDDAFADFETWT